MDLQLLLLAWAAIIVVVIVASMLFRTVVPTNQVHIVQSTKKTTPYGKDLGNGAVYFAWPSWLPFIGITRIILPMSIFTVDLSDYQAYDQGKVPFVVDIKAWFRITEASMAAQRIENFEELNDQLDDILKGAVRKILASSDIESIMEWRKEFGTNFKQEVIEQANEYGVDTINIEFMDIRDPSDGSSKTISDIMGKKKSAIERESRVVIAENMKTAKIAEIQASKEADIKEQEALEQVGTREAQKMEAVGIAKEKSDQAIQEEAKTTTQKRMNVLEVEEVRSAEIEKQKQIVQASQDKETIEIRAAADASQSEIIADGEMKAEKKKAEGIQAVGLAQAEAEKAMQLAPVTAQIELAKEIGSNEWYMNYLLGIDGIKAGQAVGIAKADALANGDMKIMVNSWDTDTGVNNLMDLLSGKWWASIGAMLEVLKQTPAGQELYDKFMKVKEVQEQVVDNTITVETKEPTTKK